VVDDEPSVRDIVKEFIAYEGYQATVASGGSEALEILEQNQIDLVITDLMMPEMNGWQLLKIIKKRFQHISVVVLTGYISEEGEKMLTNSQIDGYLVKPIDRTRLNELLKTLSQTRKSGQIANIVAIDDDPDALAAIDHALANRGFHVTLFRDPNDALQYIKETRPDLLILDLLMPNTDGFEICRILRQSEKTARIPILVLSSAPSRANVAKAIQLNVTGFMAKPFEAKILADRVLQALKTNPSKPNG
jgi:CheY-like chemotaxis protein